MAEADDIARRAVEAGLQICVAESLTSGRLASAVGAGSDAGTWFRGGIVAYQIEVKERLLGLAPRTDPCSAECAEQLASGACELFDADVAVSITGVGGPDPQDGHSPGTVFLGWSSPAGRGHRLLHLEGEPEQVIELSVQHAIDLLLDAVSGATISS